MIYKGCERPLNRSPSQRCPHWSRIDTPCRSEPKAACRRRQIITAPGASFSASSSTQPRCEPLFASLFCASSQGPSQKFYAPVHMQRENHTVTVTFHHTWSVTIRTAFIIIIVRIRPFESSVTANSLFRICLYTIRVIYCPSYISLIVFSFHMIIDV